MLVLKCYKHSTWRPLSRMGMPTASPGWYICSNIGCWWRGDVMSGLPCPGKRFLVALLWRETIQGTLKLGLRQGGWGVWALGRGYMLENLCFHDNYCYCCCDCPQECCLVCLGRKPGMFTGACMCRDCYRALSTFALDACLHVDSAVLGLSFIRLISNMKAYSGKLWRLLICIWILYLTVLTFFFDGPLHTPLRLTHPDVCVAV